MTTRPGKQPTWTTERAIDGAARAGSGVVSIDELRAVGVDDERRRRALRRGGLIPVRPGVYRPTGVQVSEAAAIRAACRTLGSHAVASHRSALWLWGLADHPGLIELTVPLGHRGNQPGLIVHRSTDLTDRHRTVRGGVPVTRPARSLLDAAAVIPRAALGRAVEQALIDQLVSVAGLRTILDVLGRRGRRGAGPLRAYLDMRALDDQRAESQLEPLMARLIRSYEVGPVLFQRTVALDGRRFRPDFQFPEVLLAVEVDGHDTHRDRESFHDDLTRQNAFIRNGWSMLRYTSSHLRRPARVAREIIETARDRRVELSA